MTIEEIFPKRITDEFYASVRKDGLYPIKNKTAFEKTWNKSVDREVFIYGQGCVKIGKKKLIPPLGDLTVSGIEGYKETHGTECVVYALTGETLSEHNTKIVDFGKELDDVIHIIKYGERFLKIVDNMEYINDQIEKFIYSILFDKAWMIDSSLVLMNMKDFKIRLHSRLCYCYMGPMMDPIEDEEKLDRMFRIKFIKKELFKDDTFLDLLAWYPEGNWPNRDIYDHWHRRTSDIVDKKRDEVFREMLKSQYRNMSVKDKMAMLLGEKAAELYDENLKLVL